MNRAGYPMAIKHFGVDALGSLCVFNHGMTYHGAGLALQGEKLERKGRSEQPGLQQLTDDHPVGTSFRN